MLITEVWFTSFPERFSILWTGNGVEIITFGLFNETTKFHCFLWEAISVGCFDLLVLFFNLDLSMIAFRSFLFKWGLWFPLKTLFFCGACELSALLKAFSCISKFPLQLFKDDFISLSKCCHWKMLTITILNFFRFFLLKCAFKYKNK